MREYPGSPVRRIASGAQDDDYNRTEYLMSHIPLRLVQGVCVHYYTSIDRPRGPAAATDFDEQSYIYSLASALKMDEIVTRHSVIMDKYDPQKKGC